MVKLALFDVPQKFQVRMEFWQYTFRKDETNESGTRKVHRYR